MRFFGRSILLFLVLTFCWAGVLPPASAAARERPSEIFTLHGPALTQALQQAWTSAWQRPGVLTGPAKGPSVVVFFDPNCPFCAHLWRELQPWQNRLRVRWIPVAFVRPDSLGMAVGILYAAHPWQAMGLNESHYDFRTRRGGMLPAFQIPPAQAAAIRGNTALWRRVFGVTPMILYPSATGMRGLFSLPNPQQLRMVFQVAQAAKRTATP